ncbi:MAG TPA: Rv0909 family putative TA system antitoxin [Micromonosporaceae bacterium]|nr:Rv0909 family putative TA system antitoxin [Micromonosporaceae bacterium]
MGIDDSMGGMEDKAKDMLSGEKGDEAIDKGADKADDMTGHKMTGGIDKGAASVKESLDKQDDQ